MSKYALSLFFTFVAFLLHATDIALTIQVKDHEIDIGGKTTCKVTLHNEGKTSTGPIVVAINLTPGTVVISQASAATHYDITLQRCEFTGFSASESQKSIELTLQVQAEGPSIISAEIIKMAEKDTDSTPSNSIFAEDDMKFEYISVPIMFCSNEVIKLKAHAFSGYPSYTWYHNGVVIPGETKEVIEITKVGKYTYEIPNSKVGTDYFSAPITVGQREAATLVQLSLGNQINTCAGEQLQVSANASNGAAPYSYKWSNDLNWDLNKPLKANMKMKLTCIVTDKHGCRNTDSVLINVNDCNKNLTKS